MNSRLCSTVGHDNQRALSYIELWFMQTSQELLSAVIISAMNTHTVYKYLLALGLALAPAALVAEDFSSLEERMTAREFADAGLNKLSDEELVRLNEWIRQRSLAEGEVATPAPRSADGNARGEATHTVGLPTPPSGPIETHIVGTFNGWDGPTEFEMADGSVWETTESRTFQSRTLENPAVTIKKRVFSGWQMRVEGYNTRVNVRRIR